MYFHLHFYLSDVSHLNLLLYVHSILYNDIIRYIKLTFLLVLSGLPHLLMNFHTFPISTPVSYSFTGNRYTTFTTSKIMTDATMIQPHSFFQSVGGVQRTSICNGSNMSRLHDAIDTQASLNIVNTFSILALYGITINK